MPVFKWEGKSRNGEVKKGTIEAANEQAVSLRLKQQNIAPTKIEAAAGGLLSGNIEFKIPGLGGGIKPKSLIIFTRQFATMIDAGLPLVQGLDILANQVDDKNFQKCLFQVKTDVESGSTFAAALERHSPAIFPDLYCALVAAGELGGILDTILERLAQYLEKNAALLKKVKGAATYPVAVAVISLGVIIGLLTYVIPSFAKTFASMSNAELPELTRMVMDLSEWAVANFHFIVIGIASVVGGWIAIRTNKQTRFISDGLALKMPVLGDTIRKVAVARFTRTLATMISSGIPIIQALETVQRTAGNLVIEKAIEHVRQKIAEGKSMAEPLMATGVFPSMVVQMIAVGEATGALDAMLVKIADFYDEEVDEAVDAMTALLEPLMMSFLAVIVGTMLIAMYLPIFKIAGAV